MCFCVFVTSTMDIEDLVSKRKKKMDIEDLLRTREFQKNHIEIL